MYQPINWESIPKHQVAELKEALQNIVKLIENHEKVVVSLGFEVLKPIDSLSFNFAIFTANYEAAIWLGKHLERIYQSKNSDSWKKRAQTNN